MCDDRVIRRFAGVFVIVSALLAWMVHPAWLAFTVFVGFNLLQSSFTRFCPLERVLGHLGFPGCSACRADPLEAGPPGPDAVST